MMNSLREALGMTTATTIRVDPGAGRRVRDPATMQLIGPGTAVDPTDPYWFRRLRDGDVTPTAAAPAAPADQTTQAELAKAQADLSSAETDLAAARTSKRT